VSDERFLITGALGCIGAWSCAQLVREDVPVVVYDLGTNTERLELVMAPDEVDRLTIVAGDVTDLGQLERTIADHEITHVIHLAAMLLPLVKADPPRGAVVNVVGTTNVFEAARRHGIRGIAYASSAAVYGPGVGARVEDAGDPTSLYGVFKLANELTARVFYGDEGVGSVGLRPYVVYGPGRDHGLTADPTLAMAAAARGDGYAMGWGGRCQLQFAPDVARIFIAAARAEHEGAAVFNLGGPSSHASEVVAAIEAAAPEVAGRVTFDDVQLPFPEEMDDGGLEDVVGPIDWTPLSEGTRRTIEAYRPAAVSSPRARDS
jgi:nucleoside-diphosphate-sugar epimerase